MMTFANAFIALRRVRRGEVVAPHVLVQLRRRGLVRGPLCIKRESHGPRGHGYKVHVWERVWTITSDGCEVLELGENALDWYERERVGARRSA